MASIRRSTRFLPWIFSAAAILSLIATTGCSRSEALSDGDGQRPRVLRIGWSPSEEEPERRVRMSGLQNYLSEKLGMPVELIETGQYSTQIEALRARKIEVGGMGPFAYVVAREKVNIEPLVSRGTPTGEPSTYRSVFIVPAQSDLKSMDDVKAQANRLTLAFVDPASASGHLMARAFLESVDLVPERDFKQVIFTLSHLASVMTVKSGKVDVAATSLSGLNRFFEKERIAPGEVRIIWESDPMITDVTTVRSDLPADFREELRQAYLSFRTDAPEAWALYRARFPDPNSVWKATQDSEFDALRAVARSVKHMDLLD